MKINSLPNGGNIRSKLRISFQNGRIYPSYVQFRVNFWSMSNHVENKKS
jgi:hypothetical protein